eukprot:1154446-Pelagomonas_calceolata.AAC.2
MFGMLRACIEVGLGTESVVSHTTKVQPWGMNRSKMEGHCIAFAGASCSLLVLLTLFLARGIEQGVTLDFFGGQGCAGDAQSFCTVDLAPGKAHSRATARLQVLGAPLPPPLPQI